ncbi:MAG: hypothetical protein KAT15_19820 [Bacteroidales bacterium]|nr:hypothetical protein [Bacteroidales bacterium]
MKYTIFLLLFIGLLGCSNKEATTAVELMNPDRFDTLVNGKQVEVYTLINAVGASSADLRLKKGFVISKE